MNISMLFFRKHIIAALRHKADSVRIINQLIEHFQTA